MIPVFCTAKVEPKLIDEFLRETYDAYPEAAQYLVLVTTTDWSHYDKDEAKLSPEEAQKQGTKVLTHGGGPMKVPSRPPWKDDFESPFLDQSPEDVAQALREAQGAPGSLSRDYCAILDEQSVKGRSVLLVKTRRSEGDNLPPGYEKSTIVLVRESFKEANAVLQSAKSGVSSLTEILWNQQHLGEK